MYPTVATPPVEKPPVSSERKGSVVLYLGDDTVQVDNDTYWRTKRAMICACAIVLTTLILVAGTLGAITIVLTHNDRVVTSETQPILDREPLFGNEVPINLPEATIRIKIDDGGLWPPTEPVTPDLIAIDDDESIFIETDSVPTSTKIPVEGAPLDQENDDGTDNGSGTESEGVVGYSESDSDSSASESSSSYAESPVRVGYSSSDEETYYVSE